jgi:hypothetical protein
MELFKNEIFVTEDEEQIFVLEDIRINAKTEMDHVIKGFSRAGKVIFNWSARDHLKEIEKYLGVEIEPELNKNGHVEFLNLNSLQVIGSDKLEKQNSAFRPGNILVNCSLTNFMFVIERETGKIVWHHSFHDYRQRSDRWKGALEVRLRDSGEFDVVRSRARFTHDLIASQFSSVEIMDMNSFETKWVFQSNPVQDFYVSEHASIQRLGNDNFLVTNSDAGAAFEVNTKRRIVWEWINPELDELQLSRPLRKVQRLSQEHWNKILRRWKLPS